MLKRRVAKNKNKRRDPEDEKMAVDEKDVHEDGMEVDEDDDHKSLSQLLASFNGRQKSCCKLSAGALSSMLRLPDEITPATDDYFWHDHSVDVPQTHSKRPANSRTSVLFLNACNSFFLFVFAQWALQIWLNLPAPSLVSLGTHIHIETIPPNCLVTGA